MKKIYLLLALLGTLFVITTECRMEITNLLQEPVVFIFSSDLKPDYTMVIPSRRTWYTVADQGVLGIPHVKRRYKAYTLVGEGSLQDTLQKASERTERAKEAYKAALAKKDALQKASERTERAKEADKAALAKKDALQKALEAKKSAYSAYENARKSEQNIRERYNNLKRTKDAYINSINTKTRNEDNWYNWYEADENRIWEPSRDKWEVTYDQPVNEGGSRGITINYDIGGRTKIRLDTKLIV